MATKKAAKKINVRIGKRRRTRTTHGKRRRSRRVSGLFTPKRRRSRSAAVGAIKAGTIKQIAFMAIGVAGGYLGTHFLLRPVERKLTDKWPKLGVALPGGEIFLGGMMALFSKSSFLKAVGVGILANGTEGVLKQLKIYNPQPAINGYEDGMSGFDEIGEYSEIRVPISGSFTEQIAGLLADSRRDVATRMVAGTQNRTKTIAETEDISGWEDNTADVSYVKY